LSQPCDIRCGLGTARDRDPDADDRALAIPAADRELALVAGHDDADQRLPDLGAGQASGPVSAQERLRNAARFEVIASSSARITTGRESGVPVIAHRSCP
jgi:hypothetical protein